VVPLLSETLEKQMRTATFRTEQEAHQFAVQQKNQGYIVDGVYQPTTPGGRGIVGLWMVIYH
jgi:hypothetical protein